MPLTVRVYLIFQGLNGGILPSSIDSQISPMRLTNGSVTDAVEKEIRKFTQNIGHCPLVQELEEEDSFMDVIGEHFDEFEFGLNSGGIQKDVLLVEDVCFNRVAIAGRKRGREVADDESDDWKRVRRLELSGETAGQWSDGMNVECNADLTEQPPQIGNGYRESRTYRYSAPCV